MVIRKMNEEDLSAIYQMECNIFSKPWSRMDFLESIRNPCNIYMVAQNETSIVGYCGLWGVVGEGQINNVAVASEFRNQGVACTMLYSLLEEGKKQGLEAFTLEVRISNLAAIKVYHKLGFQDAGIRKGFYEAPAEDALIMWKHEVKEPAK